jgi:hypothetical protein
VSLETMSFILGGILVGAGLFGGGLELKELKLPQIGPIPRVLSAVVGAVFVGLAIFLNPKATTPTPTPAGAETRKTAMTFQEPMLGDLRLDACLEWAQKCGEPAATAWCKTKGMSRAIEYPHENVGERGFGTRLVGTNQVCKEKFCASFVYIVCEK